MAVMPQGIPGLPLIATVILNIIALVIATVIVYRLYKLYKLIGLKNILILSLGYIVLAVGLALSAIAGYFSYMDLLEHRGTQLLMLSTTAYGYGYRVGTHAWSIIQLSGIVYAIAYALILVALIRGLEKIHYSALILVSPVVIGDIVSTALLSAIVFVHRGRIGGKVGYIILLLSHIIRLISAMLLLPQLLMLAEALRPIALLIIALMLWGLR